MAAVASDKFMETTIQQPQGPVDAIVFRSGSQLVLETGAKLYVGGADVTGAVATGGVAGIAAGYILARGEAALDGSNPTPIATGLTTVVAFVAMLKGSVAPGVGTSVLTGVISSGTVNVYGWKPTSNADPTLIASTGTDSFYWIAVGV